MIVIETIQAFHEWRRKIDRSRQDPIVPFVPTMGALHEGHAFLVRRARETAPREQNGQVIASIFVNPTQFGPREDFSRYPRTLQADLAMLEQAGCDAVLVPAVEELFPGIRTLNTEALADAKSATAASGHTAASVEPGPMATILEGAIRPGHFRGVCTVVAKLLNITRPTHLLLGQKDFQQQAILRQMCADLNFPVEVVTCPTIRESDGLAMSSRNRYLSPDDRRRATALFEALTWARIAFEKGERQAAILDAGMDQRLRARDLIPDYALAAHAHSLAPYRDAPGGMVNGPCILLIAARLGSTRLLDNMLL